MTTTQYRSLRLRANISMLTLGILAFLVIVVAIMTFLYQFAVTAPQISWHIRPHPSFRRRPEPSEFNQWKYGDITTSWY